MNSSVEGQRLERRFQSLKTARVSFMVSGFMCGYTAFMYFWVVLLEPLWVSLYFGSLVVGVAYVVIYLVWWRPLEEEYQSRW